MKRPFLDQLATTLFQLETERVKQSSEVDDQGRLGEPYRWSEENSWANKFSQFMATRAYSFKQFIADIVAGSDYNREATAQLINDFIHSHDVAMFSFSTCPFCRRAKDELQARGIPYTSMELDELEGNVGNVGNEIRAELGRLTKRTSVPSIFIQQTFIGGCNDGSPGLIPLLERGEQDIAWLQNRTS
jgi:glutaredoxin 3